MENNYSNYDMLDKLIANNKKAKSWTAFWVILLSLMAAAVLGLAYTVSEKNKALSEKDKAMIQMSSEYMEMKSVLIDSLTAACKDSSTAIINKIYDSLVTPTQVALDIVNQKTQPGSNSQFTSAQQEKLKKVNTSIANVKNMIRIEKKKISDDNTRLFIQYNNPKEKDNVNKFLSVLKTFTEYLVVPPEFINDQFSTVIKFYNYDDDTPAEKEKEEITLKRYISSQFKIPASTIQVKYLKNIRIKKKTVEIWLGTLPVTKN